MDKNGQKFDEIDEATPTLTVKACSATARRLCLCVVVMSCAVRRVVFNCRLFVCPGSAVVCYQNYAMLPLDCDTTLAQPRDTHGSSSQSSMVITRGSVYLSEVGAYYLW